MDFLPGVQLEPEGDPRITALKDLLDKREKSRDTNTIPRRSAVILLLRTLSRDTGIEEYRWLADAMADAWAGEGGWDRHTLVDALGRDRNGSLPSQPGKLP